MLEIKEITAGYGDTTVLRDVSLSVPSGCVVALLGPNGAGKTTLLKVASGLIRPSSGSVTLDGQDLTGAAAADYARAGICHIPEGRGIFRSMTVRDNLLLQSAPGEEKEAIERAVDVFPRLGERLSQRGGTMSGGEQKMLAVTRAYLANPQLVLLDEVSLGLAPIVVDEIFAFFGRLAERGTSLLIVEQYVQRALAIADFVFLLHQGRMAFAGETAEVDADEIFATYVGANVA
jgi:branched-chain amino acid transport system ATP-binding protein